MCWLSSAPDGVNGKWERVQKPADVLGILAGGIGRRVAVFP